MKYFLMLVAVLAAIFIVFVAAGWLMTTNIKAVPASPRATNHVTLRAAPGNTMVQMFDVLVDGPDVKVTTFPDGWGCIKLGDKQSYAGMSFYRLKCGTKTGYVNADWVRVR